MFTETKDFCLGYMTRASSGFQRPNLRMIRSDGKIMCNIPERMQVSLGMIVGFPTAEQYELAAEDALNIAKTIREREARYKQNGNIQNI